MNTAKALFSRSPLVQWGQRQPSKVQTSSELSEKKVGTVGTQWKELVAMWGEKNTSLNAHQTPL